MKFRPFGLQEIPSDWVVSTISDVSKLVTRGKQPKYQESGTMVLNQKMIQNDGIHYEFAKRHDAKKNVKSDLFINQYDIVLNSTGTGTAGRSQIFFAVPAESLFMDSHVTLIRPDSKKVNPIFMFAQLHDARYVKYIEEVLLAGSTGQVELSKSKVLDMPILLPPASVQEKYGKLYELLMRKQSFLRAINDNLQAISSAVWDSLNKPRQIILSDLMTIKSGKRPPVKVSDKDDLHEIPIIGASKIMGYTDSILSSESIITTGRVGTHGVIQRYREPVWVSDNSFVITSDYEESVYQLLKKVDYDSLNHGTTQPLITQTDLKKYEFSVPTDGDMEAYESHFAKLTELIFNNDIQVKTLMEIRNQLLEELIN